MYTYIYIYMRVVYVMYGLYACTQVRSRVVCSSSWCVYGLDTSVCVCVCVCIYIYKYIYIYIYIYIYTYIYNRGVGYMHAVMYEAE